MARPNRKLTAPEGSKTKSFSAPTGQVMDATCLALSPLQAYYWPRGRQLVGNRSDVDAIHIGAVAYQLPTSCLPFGLPDARTWPEAGFRGGFQLHPRRRGQERRAILRAARPGGGDAAFGGLRRRNTAWPVRTDALDFRGLRLAAFGSVSHSGV